MTPGSRSGRARMGQASLLDWLGRQPEGEKQWFLHKGVCVFSPHFGPPRSYSRDGGQYLPASPSTPDNIVSKPRVALTARP